MTRIPLEILLQGDRAYVESWSQRNEFHTTVNAVGQNVVRPGDSLDENLLKDNGFYLLSGTHVGFEWDSPGSRITAAPGAKMNRLAVFGSEAHVEGLDFIGSEGENNVDHLVQIKATGDVTFINCRFIKDESMPPTFVKIESGGKARFVGCLFGGVVATAGSVIDNLGAPANVGVLAANKTGNGLGNVTAIFETT